MPEQEFINGETRSDVHTTNDHVTKLGNAPQDALEPTAERVPLLVATSSGHGSSSAQCSTTSSTDGFIHISSADGAQPERQADCNSQVTDQHNEHEPSGRIQAAIFLLCKLRR